MAKQRISWPSTSGVAQRHGMSLPFRTWMSAWVSASSRAQYVTRMTTSKLNGEAVGMASLQRGVIGDRQVQAEI